MLLAAALLLLVPLTAAHAVLGRATEGEHLVHVVLRVAYLLPLILCAFAYGALGGVLAALVTSLLYGSYVLGAWPSLPWENANQAAMIAVYWVTGSLTGVLVDRQRREAARQRRLEEEYRRGILISALGALESALEFRDQGTARHGEAVAELAAGIASRMDLSEEQIDLLRLAGRIHDLGKIGIRDDVLYSPDQLSPEERHRMEAHPDIAADILAAVPGAARVSEIVRAHHEFLDGSGYPRGLLEAEIPVEARILTVADVFCALTEPRPYQAMRSEAEALALLGAWSPKRISAPALGALRACLEDRPRTRSGRSAAAPGSPRSTHAS
jgi:HD-GYP domain-containing protein (c-di-GMP phosphodiesterase class II)